MASAWRHFAGLCWSLAALALILDAPQAQGAAPTSPTASTCAAGEGWRFLCEAQAAEDIVAVPGTRWLVASALNLGRPAFFSLIDGKARTAEPLAMASPASSPRSSGCPGPPDLARMSTDGLSLRPGRGGVHRLYAANHGDRRAIEMFRLDVRGHHPMLVWLDCAMMPARTLPNAVAALPDGGLLVVSFHDPDDDHAWQKMARGEPTGKVLAWHADKGFRTVPDSAMSGGNGIAVARDGAVAYVSAWSGRRLIVLPLNGGSRREIALDFLPDNVHLLVDGSLLVAGQRSHVADIASCTGSSCPQPWSIVRVTPASGAVAPIARGPGGTLVNYACGALPTHGTLYMTSRGIGGIAYRPAAPGLNPSKSEIRVRS